jgi:type I restriction-modification system DNA methylase subunit
MPTALQIQQALEHVNDQASFIDGLLRNTLEWPIPEDINEPEDMSYLWTDEDLGTNDLARDIVSGQIFQLQPMRDDQPWGIFIVEFQNEEAMTAACGLTGPMRKILRGLVPRRRNRSAELQSWEREDLLFICTYNYQHFRFAYFKSPLQKGHAEPLTTFGWEDGNVPRTTCEFNLNHLSWPREEASPDQWVSEWSKAFDVERVTNNFYEDYERVFTNLQTRLELPTDEDKKMFAQILMNRLMFLRFIERKSWLKLGNSNPKEYLKNLYQAESLNGLSWYRSRLQVLFFEGLAVPNHEKKDIVGSVPYLNGGLFTITEWDERAGDIAGDVFEPILGKHGLLYKYNFTVEESTPLDIEVAVDPEMLGKVFEKLVTARRQQGSYYTPRTVVSFMCRESLKGHLGSQWSPLIDEHKNDDISVPQARELLARLSELKVVDPACGSGAYLLGMLQELYTITELLDSRAEQATAHDAYQRKLQIIQNNIYGVDLDEFAVNIARLRLWLSLAVEFEDDTPDPLPNLDYKIEIGDSLLSYGYRPSGLDAIETCKKQFFQETNSAKKWELKANIDKTIQKQFVGSEKALGVQLNFDYQINFSEIWNNRDGFDIVIANPPYGIKVDNSVRNHYFNQRNANEKGQSKDSYGIFMARGLQLLKPDGIMSYIVSDTWRTIKSHKPLRKRILDKTTVFHFLDLPAWIFDATVNTGIITFRKSQASQVHKLIAGDLRGIENGDWRTLSANLMAVSGHGSDIQTLNCARYTYKQDIISTYDNLSFFIGSPTLYSLMSNQEFQKLDDIADVKQGLATADNEFYIRKQEEARGSYGIIDEELLLTDEQIRNLTDDERQNGVNPDNYEGRHFLPYDKGGASDADEGWLPNYHVPTEYFIDWSENSVNRLRTATVADVKRRKGKEDEIKEGDEDKVASRLQNSVYYFREGVTFSSRGVYSPTFRLKCLGPFDKESSCVFPSSEVNNLLGILASKLSKYLFRSYIQDSVSSDIDAIKQIVVSSNIDFSDYIDRIVENQRDNPQYNYSANEQREIDALVYQLYEIDEENIREVELWYCRRYPRLAQAQGVLAEVREKYADHLERCERVLEKPPSYWRSNPILELIAQGESHTLEFKETLEYDVRQNQRNRDLAKSSLKTVAAFLNTDGGTLLIGVSDAAEIKGIDRDLAFVQRNNLDGFEQKLRSLLNDRFDPSPRGNVEITFEELQEGTVCQIRVEQNSESVAFDNDFYIRDGNGTRKLEGRELADWIQQRS